MSRPLALGEAAPAPELHSMARPARLYATFGLMLATAMQAADATIVNVALPRLYGDLGGGVALGAWVLTAYLCATAAVAPLTTGLRRRFGARRLFVAAVGGFVAASLLCAAAPSAAAIILFRILQGAAGGVIQPLAQAVLLDLYPKERHGRIFALSGAVLMVGPILGPLLGGVITDLWSWRWAFAINLPVGLVALWATRSLRAAPVQRAGSAPIDAVAAGLLMLAIGAVQLCLERGVGRSWLHSPELLAEAATAAAAVGLLAIRARRSGFSVFRLDVFRDLNFAAAAVYNVVLSAVLFVALVFVPLASEGPLGYPATVAGSLIVPRAVMTMLVILWVGRLIGRVDRRLLILAGWLLMAAGLAVLARLKPADAVVALVLGSTIQALGAGLLFTPLSTLAVVTLPVELRTDATGLYSLLRQLACASGVALMTAVLRYRIGANLTAAPDSPPMVAELSAYGDCFRMMAFACLAVIPGVLLLRPPRAEQESRATV